MIRRLAPLAPALAIAAACLGWDCHANLTPTAPVVTPDGGTVPAPAWDTSDVCGSAWARLGALECHAQEPTTGRWVDACRVGRQHGLKFGVQCIRDATRREQLAACGVDCR